MQKKFDPNNFTTYHYYQHLWRMNPEKIEYLIEQSKKRDTAAFRQLVEAFQPLVFRLAFRLLCNDDEAKDIVQEAFIRVWLHLHKYRHGTQFSTWLYRIACNLCYDRQQRLNRLIPFQGSNLRLYPYLFFIPNQKKQNHFESII